MAGAKPGVHNVQLKPINVPDTLTQGSKFIKWEDVSTVRMPLDALAHLSVCTSHLIVL